MKVSGLTLVFNYNIKYNKYEINCTAWLYLKKSYFNARVKHEFKTLEFPEK